ncbi:SMODS domain-containing nucleotidyltransferase [Caenimonas soli]|uniref:SMODS domain-containing nucleotidyltransferase n=1 Tax=Caenimonas soli TaxID=2735555 RepID=UPI001554B4DC|nr:nucleotidyltransferase [Caenimonas soli]NPC58538.1 nucleotidyltransferase [Caenimonas soli]
MKLLEHFKKFLDDQVNLNQTRVDQLIDSIEAVKKVIRESDWKPKIIEFAPQGSWAHKTIIKPLPDKEFDADLLAFVEPVEGWEAKDYVNKLYSALEASSTYKDKLRRYSHCVTIEYAGERRMDIAPVVRGRIFKDRDEVCNRNSNEFEVSAPKAYTDWVVQKNSIAGGNDLRKVTRLLKYMRDIKGNFTCPSFLLTTLLGYRISDSDKGADAFADTPTALKTLLGRLDDWLQANPTLPEVRNPVLYSEVQSSVWDEIQYSNFRDKVNLYRGWVDDAYEEEDRDESIGKWRRVFGDDFAPGETKEAASRISEAVDAVAKSSGAVVVAGHFKDLVDWVKHAGTHVIPARLRRLPHVERPKWRAAKTSLAVKVSAQLLDPVIPVSSGQPLAPERWIRFNASSSVGTPFPTNDYTVWWRVTNTDKVAYQADALRGDFYKSDADTPMSRAEYLSYRGVHFVEAFLVRKADGRLTGQSDPFYVVIE